MKWIGGVALLIITIILLILAMFMFPWFTTKTTYERETINDPEEGRISYWEESLGGIERDWDESVYYLQEYELKTSRQRIWNDNSSLNSTSSGKMRYNSDPSAGGWEGSYGEIVDAGYPVPGYLAGGKEQLNVYNFAYYMSLIAIILAVISIIIVALAGIGKINHKIPKIVVGITVIFVVISSVYFAFALPSAIETDNEELHFVKNTLSENSSYSRPAEAAGIWGNTNEFDTQTKRIFSTKEFRPGVGWWLMIGAIFTSILTLAFTSGPPPAAPIRDDNWRRRYHEFDRQYDDDHYRDRNGYYDDYDRPPPRRPTPPPSYDYGRPTPRPPRRGTSGGRGSGYPPRGRGRRPPGY